MNLTELYNNITHNVRPQSLRHKIAREDAELMIIEKCIMFNANRGALMIEVPIENLSRFNKHRLRKARFEVYKIWKYRKCDRSIKDWYYQISWIVYE
jgi:hypothetical protein